MHGLELLLKSSVIPRVLGERVMNGGLGSRKCSNLSRCFRRGFSF